MVEDTWPAWRSDGKWIAFGRAIGTKSRDIWVLDLSTNKTYQLTKGGSCGKPTWSADGTSLYYTCFDNQNEDLWVATDIVLPPPGAAAYDALTSNSGAAKAGTKAGARAKTVPKRTTKAGTPKAGAAKASTAK